MLQGLEKNHTRAQQLGRSRVQIVRYDLLGKVICNRHGGVII
jgi:hypothetical protein